MPFVEMDPEVIWKLVEGYQNELAPEHLKLEAYYRQFSCPQCQGACRKEIVASHMFADPSCLVPRALLRCLLCECLFNPHITANGQPMIVEMGGR